MDGWMVYVPCAAPSASPSLSGIYWNEIILVAEIIGI
jgi:hypothetical protein